MKAVSHYPHGTKGEYRQIKKESGLEVSHALMSITSKGDMNMVAEVELKLSRAVTDFATNNPEKVIAEQRQLLIKVDRLKLCKLKTMEIPTQYKAEPRSGSAAVWVLPRGAAAATNPS